MRSLILTASLLLCSLNSSSGSGYESRSMQVQAGGDVTMLCSNFSSIPSQIIWFRVAKGSKFKCVFHMFEAHEAAKTCEGFESDKFVGRTNLSTTFLQIKKVNSSDSGLYFCGSFFNRRPVLYDTTHLEVHEELIGLKNLRTGILGAVTVLLVVVIIYLAVHIRKLQKTVCDLKTKQAERRGSDQLDYAAVTFQPNSEANRRHSSARETDPSVIYATPRQTQDAPGAAQLTKE